MSALLLIALLSPVEEKTISFRQLERLAVDAYKEKDRWFRVVEPEYSGGTLVRGSRGNLWASDPVKDHKYQPILIELLRLEMWEQYRPPFVNAKEHEKVLSACRSLIHDYYKALEKRNNNRVITNKAIEAEYEKGLSTIAKQKGISLAWEYKAFGFLVDLETDPPGATIHMMSVLKWRLLEYEGKDPREELKAIVLTQTKRLDLIGWYYYSLEWPNKKTSGPFKTPVVSENKLLWRST